MPMKPQDPEALKGLAQELSTKARLLGEDEVDKLTDENEEDEDEELEEDTE